jgi:hypothetical protein
MNLITVFGNIFECLDHHRDHLLVCPERDLVFLGCNLELREQHIYGAEGERSLVRED